MNPTKVRREAVHSLTDLPNVGPATAADLRLLGITRPADLAQADPFALYQALCQQTATRHDPCVLDVFMSITDFAAETTPQQRRASNQAVRMIRFGQESSVMAGRPAAPITDTAPVEIDPASYAPEMPLRLAPPVAGSEPVPVPLPVRQ